MASSSLMSPRSGGLMANPFQLLQREMNRLFDDVFNSDFAQPQLGIASEAAVLMPRMEVRETDQELRVVVELPGVTEKDIDVALDDDVLTIRGEKKMERTETQENMQFSERSYGTFQRSFAVPDGVDRDNVTANFANGVLTITMPKTAKALEQQKKIEVKAVA